MSGTDILLRSDVMIDNFDKQLRLLADESNKALECPLVKF
jgi:hypothetical protein